MTAQSSLWWRVSQHCASRSIYGSRFDKEWHVTIDTTKRAFIRVRARFQRTRIERFDAWALCKWKHLVAQLALLDFFNFNIFRVLLLCIITLALLHLRWVLQRIRNDFMLFTMKTLWSSVAFQDPGAYATLWNDSRMLIGKTKMTNQHGDERASDIYVKSLSFAENCINALSSRWTRVITHASQFRGMPKNRERWNS